MVRKRKHVTVTIAKKLEIIWRIEKEERVSKLIEKFNMDQSTIYDIKKQSKDLKQYIADSESIEGCEKRKTLKKPVLKQLDEVLYKWFTGKKIRREVNLRSHDHRESQTILRRSEHCSRGEIF